VVLTYAGTFTSVTITRDGVNIASGVTTTSYTDSSGVSANTSYLYAVIPMNSAGVSGTSSSITKVTLPIITTAVSVSSFTASQVVLAYAGTFTSVTITRDGVNIASGVTTTSYTDSSGVSANTSYLYAVIPVNSASVSGSPSSITKLTLPSAPIIGTASVVDSSSVSIAFTVSTGGASNYIATSSPGGIISTGTNTTSPIIVWGLTAGTAYTFIVTATNASGTASSGSSNSVTTSSVTGPAPTDYVAYIGMNGSSWTPNTTKDLTNTYTLFADNSTVFNDPTRGYVFNTQQGNGNWGVRLESPSQTLFCPSYSYSVWIKITAALSTTTPNGIVGDYLGSAGSFFLYIDVSGILTATHGSSYNTDILTYNTAFALNTWTHIGITYNNTSLLMKMYVNGVSVASKTKSASWTGFGSSTGGRVSFGYSNKLPSVAYGYTGYIDNMRLYNRDVSTSEMSNIYGFETTVPTTGFFVTPLPTLFTAGASVLSSSVSIASFTGANTYRNGTYTVSSSTVLNSGTNFACYYPFNGLTTGGSGFSWVGSTDGSNPWVQIKLPFSLIATQYTLLPWTGPNSTNAPTEWYIYGSNDGITWNTLNHKTVSTTYWTSYSLLSFPITSNTTSYSYFRLQIISASVNGGYSGIGQFNIG
jgi:hypothetical protein